MSSEPVSEFNNEPVPTEGVVWLTHRLTGTALRTPLPATPHPPRGQVDSKLLHRKLDHVRAILRQRYGDKRAGASINKRADMLVVALTLTASHGALFASADFLAARADASGKTWDRLLARLRAEGMATSTRMARRVGAKQPGLSVNLTDLGPLWRWICRLMGWDKRDRPRSADTEAVVESVGQSLWVKRHGIWELAEGPSI